MKKLLTVFCSLAFALNVSAATVDTFEVSSKSMHKIIKSIVIIPDSYTNQQNRFPVLYLLHGATDDYKWWITVDPDLRSYADQYNMIIVCPDGGYTSWYFDSPIDSTMKYETYVTKELVPEVDKHYRTVADKQDRAVTGLSMGGHGALYLAFRHQDVWGAAGSMSGGVDLRPFPNNWDLAKRLGTYATHPENWEKNTVINMLSLLDGKSLKIIFDCGVDDFFYDGNKRLHQLMVERRIPHDYVERPGGHTVEYWLNSIQYQLLFFHDFFQQKENTGDKK